MREILPSYLPMIKDAKLGMRFGIPSNTGSQHGFGRKFLLVGHSPLLRFLGEFTRQIQTQLFSINMNSPALFSTVQCKSGGCHPFLPGVVFSKIFTKCTPFSGKKCAERRRKRTKYGGSSTVVESGASLGESPLCT